MKKTNGLLRVSRGRQISVFLEDKPGTLGTVCRQLGAAGVNILALSLAEGIDHGYLRIVTSAPDLAIATLKAADYLFYEKEVVLVEAACRPGVLGEVAQRWGAAGINIEYCYCGTSSDDAFSLLAARVDDPTKAAAILAEDADR